MNLGLALIVSTLWLVVTILIGMEITRDVGQVYQCSIAEISPDYPQDVKELCRRIHK